MKKEWKSPVLEVLNVSMTMKGWHHGGKPGKEEPQGPNDPNDPFDS
ncbi:paeninodin family lasso peptide [Oceanobacillus chungangensis]|nr:paeninodin family lasso peptide [Oceanobacillus chungangensis]